MFDNIAPKYDLLNHTLSMSIDRVWRRRVVGEVRRAKPGRILDVATGTGDLAIAMARRIRDVQVLGVDLSEQMLAVARRKIEARGWTGASSSTGAMRASRCGRRVGRCGDRGVRGAQLRRPRGRAARTGPHNKTRGQSRYPGVFASPQPVFRALYEFYSYKILPASAAGVARQTGLRVSSSLGRGVSRAGGVHGDDGRAGFRNCRARSQSFGIAQIYIGER